MKRISFIYFGMVLLLFFNVKNNSKAQNSAGLSSSNFLSIQASNSNPASIIDNRFKIQLNLFSVDAYVSNNYLKIKSPLGGYNFSGYDEFRQKKLSEKDVDLAHFIQKTNIGLGAVINLGKNKALGIQYQVKNHLNIKGVEPDFAKELYWKFNYQGYYNRRSVHDKIDVNGAAWNELSLNLAFVLKDNKEHFWAMAIKPRIISGAGAFYLHSDRFEIAVNNSDTYSVTNSNLNFGYSGTFKDSFRDGLKQLQQFNNISFGGDIGFEYEFRPKRDSFDYVVLSDNVKKEYSANEIVELHYDTITERSREKYKVKFGFAFTDIGNLKFSSESLNTNIIANSSNVPVDAFKFDDLGMLRDSISHYFTATTRSGKFSMSLPTSFKTYIDINMGRGFYLNFYGQTPLNYWKAEHKLTDISFVAITPRWETNKFGVFIPLSYDQYGGFNAGLSARLWFLTVGSNALLGSLTGSKISSADAYVSLDIPIIYTKNKTKEKKLKAQNEIKTLIIHNYAIENANLNSSLSAAELKIDGLSDRIKADSLAAISMLNTITGLEGDIDMVLAENDSVYAQNAELKDNILEQQSKLAELSVKTDSLNNDISSKRARLEQLKNNLARATQESKNKDVAITVLNVQVDSLQTEVAVLTNDLDNAISARNNAKSQLTKTKNTVIGLTKEVNEAKCANVINNLNASEIFRKFTENSDVVPPGLKTYLITVVAKSLKENKTIKVEISGFANNNEKPAGKLANDRINAIKRILLQEGLNSNRIKSAPKGNSGNNKGGVKLRYICH